MGCHFCCECADAGRCGSSPPPNTACAPCAGCPGQPAQQAPSCSSISVSSAFPSVITMSQKSSVTQTLQSVPKALTLDRPQRPRRMTMNTHPGGDRVVVRYLAPIRKTVPMSAPGTKQYSEPISVDFRIGTKIRRSKGEKISFRSLNAAPPSSRLRHPMYGADAQPGLGGDLAPSPRSAPCQPEGSSSREPACR
jgi:hypothetical protein